MNEQEEIAFDALVMKVQHQEETITQLMEMVASSNRKMAEIKRRLDNKSEYSLT